MVVVAGAPVAIGGTEVAEVDVVDVDAAGTTPAKAVDKIDEVAATTPVTAAAGDAVVDVVAAEAELVTVVDGLDMEVVVGAPGRRNRRDRAVGAGHSRRRRRGQYVGEGRRQDRRSSPATTPATAAVGGAAVATSPGQRQRS